MSRNTPSALLAAFSGASFHPILLVDIEWPGGRVRAHSGVGTINWSGSNWLGVGEFGNVNLPEETSSGVPMEFSTGLVCPLAEVADYADASIRRRPGRVYLGATSAPGSSSLIGAVVVASGTMDALALEIGGSADRVEYGLNVGFTTGPSFRSGASAHHSHEDQIRIDPTDTAGRKLELTQTRAEKTRWPE